ncbi:MAG: ankyrin repeat domain-containing protein [Alphaproteobacteria bacterium]|nr:ankyrin repeat domain-containing protein [Alphaproteobacteria bacterium]
MDNSSPKNSLSPPTPSQDEVNDFVAAAGKGDTVSVTAFIDKYKPFIDLKDDSGNTALIWAIIQKQEETVELLLDKGAGISAPDRNGWPPLTHAAWHGQEAILDFLVKRGAAVDAKDNHGQTPLMRAAAAGRTRTVGRLLAKGADPAQIDFQGRTAQVFAQRARAETAALIAQWPEIRRRLEEEKRALEKKQAEDRAEAEAKKQAAAQLEKLKNLRPKKSPFKKDPP